MNRLFRFISKIYLLIIFLLLEVLAFNIYSNSSPYIRGEHHHLSNTLKLSIHNRVSSIKDYFRLDMTNDSLAQINTELRERLTLMTELNMILLYDESRPKIDTAAYIEARLADTIVVDSITNMPIDTITLNRDSVIKEALKSLDREHYVLAKVENNSVSRRKNFITLNKGSLDGIAINYPVVSGSSVVGYIVAVRDNYSVAMSLLNTDFKSSGMLKKNGSLCSITWDGERSDKISYSGISMYSGIEVGDTITTTGFSSFFTAGKVLGVVESMELKEQIYYAGTIRPIINFDRLRYLDIIIPDNLEERFEIENSINE